MSCSAARTAKGLAAIPFSAGVTLLEVVVVVVMLGIALSFSLSMYHKQVLAGKRKLGSTELRVLGLKQARYRAQHGNYAGQLTQLGYASETYAINIRGDVVGAQDSGRIYMIELSTLPGGYELRAIPQLAQSLDHDCEALKLSSSGVLSASGSKEAQSCW